MFSQMPSKFLCDLTGQTMINSDRDKNGNNYERDAYSLYVDNTSVMPNDNLKIEIDKFIFESTQKTKNKIDIMKLLKKNLEDEIDMDQLEDVCPCCCSSIKYDKFFECDNRHKICGECIKRYAENVIYQNGSYIIKCIYEGGCDCEYKERILEKILDKKSFEQYQRLKIKEETKYIFDLDGLNLIKCQFCETVWDIDKTEKVLYCRECKKSTCLECNKLEHKGSPCDKLRLKIEENLTKQNYFICPCSRCIEKVDGCNAVRCPCGNNFCWGCKKSWGGSDAHGCTCSEIRLNVMNEFNGNLEALAYIQKLNSVGIITR
jgi:hypothetical protein